MEIGKILIRLRLKTDLTQGEIADFVGVKQNTYHYWESDHTSIKHPFLPKLAEVYRVGIADLFSTNPTSGAGRWQAGLCPPVTAPLTPGTYVDYRDELIAAQKREIELLEMQIIELTNRLLGGGVNPGAVS